MHLSAQRAREINAYYHSLGEGLGQYTPPLVEHVDSNKPLSIALEEIATGKIVMSFPGDARQVAEELFGSESEEAPDAEVVSLAGDETAASQVAAGEADAGEGTDVESAAGATDALEATDEAEPESD